MNNGHVHPTIREILHTASGITDKAMPTQDDLQARIAELESELAEAKAQVAAAYELVASKLDKVSEGYLAGGHSHRALMLQALAEETRARTPADAKRQMDLTVAKAIVKELDEWNRTLEDHELEFSVCKILNNRYRQASTHLIVLESKGKAAHEQSAE